MVDLERVRELLRGGAKENLNTLDSVGYSPLMKAALFSDSVDLVRALMDEGADVNITKDYDRNALSIAAQKGKVDIVRVLLEKKVDATILNKARFVASLHNQFEAGNILDQAGGKLPIFNM